MEYLMPQDKHSHFRFKTSQKIAQRLFLLAHPLLSQIFLLKLVHYELALNSVYPSRLLHSTFFDYHCQKSHGKCEITAKCLSSVFKTFIKAVWRRIDCGFKWICKVWEFSCCLSFASWFFLLILLQILTLWSLLSHFTQLYLTL